MPFVHFHLAKTDPDTYSLADFEKDKTTVWDGVNNAQAVQSIRNMKKGDKVFIYHSMGEAAIVGLARVDSAPRPDPNNAKSAVVDLTFLRRLDPPTTLHAVKESGLFPHFALVRQSRLSTMACPEEFVDWVQARYPKIKL
jgi:predicted RNA-binding protein with PUA-like domain